MTDQNKPLSERTDDDIRDRVRELHEQPGVINIADDAVVERVDEDVAYVLAWIQLGEED